MVMKEVVKLMDYRPDIKIVDATLRDGGLVNNFRFTDEFVKDLYQTNIKAWTLWSSAIRLIRRCST